MKKRMRRCSKCLWRNDCDRSTVLCICDDYEPLDEDELKLEQYEDDLDERVKIYEDILRETGGEDLWERYVGN